MFFVYVLLGSLGGKIYIGRAASLERRLAEHVAGRVWTTSRMGRLQLVFYEAFFSQADSIRRERYLKSTKGKSTLRLMLRESLLRARAGVVERYTRGT